MVTQARHVMPRPIFRLDERFEMRHSHSEFYVGPTRVCLGAEGMILLETGLDEEKEPQEQVLTPEEAYLLGHALLKLSDIR